jgi:hypothetical protein
MLKMKRLVLLSLLIFPIFLFAQYPTFSNKQKLGVQTTGDGLIYRGNEQTPTYIPNNVNNAYFYLDTVRNTLKFYKTNQWFTIYPTASDTISLGAYLLKSDTLAMLLPYLRKTDTISLSNRINNKLNATDTVSLSNRINLKLNKTDTINLSNRIDLKLNPTDTISLSNRINIKLNPSDTVSLSNRINTKLNSNDTISLSNRINKKLDTLYVNYQTSVDLLTNKDTINITTLEAGAGINIVNNVISLDTVLLDSVVRVQNVYVKNGTGTVLNKGEAVYVTGANGTNIIVGRASNVAESTSSKTLGLTMTSIGVNGFGYVIKEGLLAGLNTNSATAGDPIWLGVNGGLIFGLANKPYAPNHLVYLGVVTRKQQNNGEVYVTVQNGFEIKELHDVQITSPSDKASLYYKSSEGLWRDTTATLLVSDTTSMLSKYVNTYGNQTNINGNKTFNNVITIDSATVTGKLLVNTTISDAVKINSNTNSTNLELANSSGSSVYIKSSNKNMILQTDTTALVYLNGDNKKVGILTMTPQQALQVAGNVRIDSLNNNLFPYRLIGSTNNNDLTNVNLGEGLSFSNDTLKVDLTIIDTAIAASSITLTGHVTGTGATNSTVPTIIGNGVVTNDMLAGSISDTKLNTITTAGKISNTAFASQTANTVLAAPNGSSGTPTFRSLVSADIPNLNYLPLTGGTLTGGLNGTTGIFTTRLGVGSIEASSVPTLFTSGSGDQEVHFTHNDNIQGRKVSLRLTNANSGFYTFGGLIYALQGEGLNQYNRMTLGINTTEVLHLTRFSRVGIMNNNPSYTLDVNGTFNASGNSLIGGTLGVTSNITANSFVKSLGTSLQFLKADGSVDANTYLTTGTAAYLPLTGGTTTGLITSSFTNTTNYSTSATDNNAFTIYNNTTSTNNIYGGLQFLIGQNSGSIPGGPGLAQIYALRVGGASNPSTDLTFSTKSNVSGVLEKMRIKFDGKVGIGTSTPNYLLDVNGQIGSTGFFKSGGLSTEFLKANGTVDNNTYLTTTVAANTYLPLSGGTISGTINRQEDNNNGSGLTFYYNILNYFARKDNVKENRTAQITFTDRPGTDNFPNAVRTSDIHLMTAHNWNGSSYGQYLDTTLSVVANQGGGSIGIGKLNPAYKLDVNGTLGVTGATTLSSTLGVTGIATLNNDLVLQTSGGRTTTAIRHYYGQQSRYAGEIQFQPSGASGSQLAFYTNVSGNNTQVERMKITENGFIYLNNYTNITGSLNVTSDGSVAGTFYNGGQTTLANLAGTGTRMVVSSSTGVLSTQAIPSSGSGTVTNVTVGSPANGLSVATGTTTPVISMALAASGTTGVVSNTTQIFSGAKTFNDNIVVNGISVGKGNNSLSDNTVVGLNALSSATSANYNVAIGAVSLRDNQSGFYNTAIGSNSLTLNTVGGYNTAVGQASLYTNTGSHNTAVGESSAEFTTGSRNTTLGSQSMYNLTTGTDNTIIGYNSNASIVNATNQIVIGSEVIGQANNTVTIGSSSGKIYNNYTTNATWIQTSDGRLKNVISKDSLGLSFINRLNPITYTWKPSNQLPVDNPYYNVINNKDTTTVIHGFVAQEIKAALDAENCSTFNGWMKGDDGIEGISREMFINPLVKAIQELSAQIEILKAEIKELKK